MGRAEAVGKSGRWSHYRTCNLCEAMCGLEIQLDGPEILSIRGDDEDPFSRGHICPKAVALQDVYADPDRLTHPVRRTSEGWERIGWNEAFDEVASRIRAIQTAGGPNAVGAYLGNPNVHNLGSMMVGGSLLKALGTQNNFTATSVDQLPHHFAARQMFGHYLLLPIPDVDRTQFFLILGANPLASNGSLMTAPGIGKRLRAIRERGGRVVLIDPRRTETAREVDRHYFIHPGRDVLLLLSLVHTIVTEELDAPGGLAEFTDGLDRLGSIVEEFAPERVAALVGIAAEEIRQLARDFAAAPSAVCYGRIGLSTQAFGGLCQWLINLLNLITGNLDRPGGAMFPTPAVDIVTAGRAGKFGRWKSRVRGLPEFAGELPTSVLAEEILTPGQGQIRGLLTVAGNPVLSTPNGRRLDEALAQLEFMVSIDIYVNETTRHADIILPPTTGLETDHYDLVFHLLAVRNTAKYSPALFSPQADARHDWQIYRELCKRLATRERPFRRLDPRNSATPAQLVGFGLKTGPYGKEGLSLAKLKAEPHGVDLGPLEPRLPERLFTKNGQIELLPEVCVNDLERVRACFVAAPQASTNGFDLTLIGRRHLCSNNSWMHNSERLVKGPERCTAMIHPQVAEERGIRKGQRVAVESCVGRVELPVEITDAMMPGVVSIPHGWGHDRPGAQLSIAGNHAGASINDLTDDQLIDRLTGNAALSGVPVRVLPVAVSGCDDV